MRKVIFPLVKDGSLIVYPDDFSLFANTEFVDDTVVADYAGALPLDAYVAPATPRALTKLEFVELAQSAGGMSDAQLVAANADPQLAALWLKLTLAGEVQRDHPATQAGLGALAALGYLPNGAAAVLDAWPAI
jgi:hypothetical protein